MSFDSTNPLDRYPLYLDAFNLLCDRKIGGGTFRDVFECRMDRSLVVKVETATQWRCFSNVKEMQFWQDNQHYKAVADWLAPCVYLSPDGRIMCQRRVTPLTEQQKKELPEKIPSFLTDLKYGNFGMLDGRLVCVDYASVISNPSVKLRKADWWE